MADNKRFYVDRSKMLKSYCNEKPGDAGSLADCKGFCHDLTGRTVVITVLADTTDCHWNLQAEEDKKALKGVLYNVSTATEWIREQTASYGHKDTYFYFSWEVYPNLLYKCKFQDTFANVKVNSAATEKEHCRWFNVERILSDFSAQNVAFLFLYRTKTDNTITATAHNALKAVSYIHKLETISMPIFYKGHYEAPAVYAHEMLHLFGAQDLYCKTALITQEYADYQNKNKTNDIMRIQTDLKTGQYNLKEITNTFSRVDAYYTYLTDRCDEVEKWGLVKRVER